MNARVKMVAYLKVLLVMSVLGVGGCCSLGERGSHVDGEMPIPIKPTLRDVEVLTELHMRLLLVLGESGLSVKYQGNLAVGGDSSVSWHPQCGLFEWEICCVPFVADDKGSYTEVVARLRVESGRIDDALVVCEVKGVTVSVVLDEIVDAASVERKLNRLQLPPLKEILRSLETRSIKI